jgi:TatD DNase family protein
VRLFDTHCHLQDERLAPALGQVLDRARAAGVEKMLCCGVSEDDWPIVARLAGQTPAIVPAYGLHPRYLKNRTARWLDILGEMLKDPRAVVGETGLDHAVKERDDGEQEQVFLAQWDLSVQLKRPVSMHCRQAWGRLMELLPTLGRHPVGFVIHSYSGLPDMIEPLAGCGAHFSFSGSITRSNNRRGHEAARRAPIDRLMIETDAPDLTPVIDGSVPDAPNEPANITSVLRRVAELRSMPETDVAELTYANACRLFVF